MCSTLYTEILVASQKQRHFWEHLRSKFLFLAVNTYGEQSLAHKTASNPRCNKNVNVQMQIAIVSAVSQAHFERKLEYMTE